VESVTPILVEPDFADDIIKACCILHNFVRKRDGYNFEDMDTSYLVDVLLNRGPGVRSQGIEVGDYTQILWDQDPSRSSITKYKKTTFIH